MTKMTAEGFIKCLEEKNIIVRDWVKDEVNEYANELSNKIEHGVTVFEKCLEQINLRETYAFETEIPSLKGSTNENFGGEDYKNSEIFVFVLNGWVGTYSVEDKIFFLTRANYPDFR